MANSPHKTAGHAFTLIELVVVMVLIGIMTAMAVLSLGGTMDRYRLTQATETFQTFDARARRQARSARRTIEATIEKDKRRLVIAQPSKQFRLPDSVEIKTVRISQQAVPRTKVKLRFDSAGHSPTYAVEFRKGKLSKWLVILGTSGQTIAMDNVGEVNALLSL